MGAKHEKLKKNRLQSRLSGGKNAAILLDLLH
jgi:hypothetical protein